MIINKEFETIIFGSGISAYFAKKENKSALVITNSNLNNSIKSGGHFRTKGVNKKSLFYSIKKNSFEVSNPNKIKKFCSWSKSIKNISELKNSEYWKYGFKNNLNFLKDFQKETINGQLVDILVKDKKVVGCFVKINNKLNFFYCKSIILCTGGFGQYFNLKKCLENPIEIAFNKGAKVKNIEFLLTHPFGLKGHVIATEKLTNSKIFNYKKERIFEIEEILKKKNAHHKLSEITSKLYSTKKSAFITFQTNKLLEIKPVSYFSLGGLDVDKKQQTNIMGLFCAGEICESNSGASRIGGVALTECVYSGIISGKESKIFNKKNKLQLLKPKEIKLNKKNLNCEINSKKIYSNFLIINNKKELKKGLINAKKEKNIFAEAFFKISLMRKESRGCFLRNDFTKTIKKFNFPILAHLDNKNKLKIIFDKN